VSGARFCLVDVYRTALHHEFASHASLLPALAGVPESAWNEAFYALDADLTVGRLSMADLYRRLLQTCGARVDEGLVAELVDLDTHLLVSEVHLYQDTVPFLRSLRDRGVRTAFVSNCYASTRVLLGALGLLDLVEGAVLSCEVGCPKPEPGIYEHALDLLGADAAETVFIDDQPGYCEGAVAVGMRAVRLDRSADERIGEGLPVAADLHGVERLIWNE
jgi:putative hydrolase of the HAD superfamily